MTCTTKYVVTPVHEHDEETFQTARREWVDRITEELPDTFDLIYIDRGDRLTDEQVRYCVRGDWDSLWESMWDWEGDARWYGVKFEMEGIKHRHGDNPPICPDCGGALCDWGDIQDELEEYIQERDSGKWFDDLVRNTRGVWMQYRPKTDGHPLDSLQLVGYDPGVIREEVRDCVARLGITPTDDIIDEIAGCICEGDYVTSSLAFKFDSSGVAIDSPAITIREGMVYVGDPFVGNGTVVNWKGELTVPRDCIELDGDTGYGVRDIFGL